MGLTPLMHETGLFDKCLYGGDPGVVDNPAKALHTTRAQPLRPLFRALHGLRMPARIWVPHKPPAVEPSADSRTHPPHSKPPGLVHGLAKFAELGLSFA